MSSNNSNTSFNTGYLDRYIDGNNSMTSSLIASASTIADKLSCSCGSYARDQVASEEGRRPATYDLNRLTSDFYANEGIHRQGSFEHDDDSVSSISASFMTPPRTRSRRELQPIKSMNSQELLGDGNTDFVPYDGRPEKTPEDDEITTSTTTTVHMSCRSSKHYEGDSSIGTSSASANPWMETCGRVMERKQKQKIVFHMEGPLFDRMNQRAQAAPGAGAPAKARSSKRERIMNMTKTTPQHVPAKPLPQIRAESPVSMEIRVPAWQKRRGAQNAKAQDEDATTASTAPGTDKEPCPEYASPSTAGRRLFVV